MEQREKRVNLEGKVLQDQRLENLENQEESDPLEKLVNVVLLEFPAKMADLDQKVKRDLEEESVPLACLAVQAHRVFLVDPVLTDQLVRKVQLVFLDFLAKPDEMAKTDILVFLAKLGHKDLQVRAFLVLLALQDFQDQEEVPVREELLERLVLLAKMVREEKLLSD